MPSEQVKISEVSCDEKKVYLDLQCSSIIGNHNCTENISVEPAMPAMLHQDTFSTSHVDVAGYGNDPNSESQDRAVPSASQFEAAAESNSTGPLLLDLYRPALKGSEWPALQITPALVFSASSGDGQIYLSSTDENGAFKLANDTDQSERRSSTGKDCICSATAELVVIRMSTPEQQ